MRYLARAFCSSFSGGIMQLIKMPRPKHSDEMKKKVFDKTDGNCHFCDKKLILKNYGKTDTRTRGNWEIDHSKPVSKGGKNHLNNYFPACIYCNRSKGNSTTIFARAKNGMSSVPLSKNAKIEQAMNRKLLKVGAAGLLGLRFGPLGVVVCMAIAAATNV